VDIAQSMTVIEYKGYRIEVRPVARGWRAAIFAPGSTRALADSPSNLEKSSTEEIVAEAKRVIDARLAPVRCKFFPRTLTVSRHAQPKRAAQASVAARE
jgi:hypothetical protein